jgi:hypothetical protein
MITLYETSYSFTRASDSTTYASGDLITNSTTSGSVVPFSWSFPSNAPGLIVGFRMAFDHPQLTGATFRMHLLSGTPTFAGGDNAAVSTAVATGHSSLVVAYEGTLSTITAAGASGLLVPLDGLVIPMRKGATAAVQTKLYGYLEARGAYPPKNGGTISAEMILEK